MVVSLDIKEKLVKVLDKYWFLRMVVFAVLRPRRLLNEFIFSWVDYLRFKKSTRKLLIYRNVKEQEETTRRKNENVLFLAGVMEAQWCQLWSILGERYKFRGCKVYVLASKGQPVQNLYFKLFKFEFVFLENLNFTFNSIPQDFQEKLKKIKTFDDFKNFEWHGVPLGKMALSTYSRTKATGIMDISEENAEASVKYWVQFIYSAFLESGKVFDRYKIDIVCLTELFMDYYGGFYYQALNRGLNIIRFAGTVRDDAIVVTHQTKVNDRTHFSSISSVEWDVIKSKLYSDIIEKELFENFDHRYGSKWKLSKRNQPDTRVTPILVMKKELGIEESDKIAIIYSHILYDTLFFNGEYLFENYAEWLVESVKAACENPRVKWFVKVHPSNLWRGELEHYLNGQYEEVRLIREYIGELPSHVRMIFPDTKYSPYSWLQLADYGVTVTGTSGIELGALGKVVLTAGTGRYENIGFTINSSTKEEYIDRLRNIENSVYPSEKQKELAKKFAYATFCMKPFTLDFLIPIVRYGRRNISASGDLVYLVKPGSLGVKGSSKSIEVLIDWSFDKNDVDLLNDWPETKNFSVESRSFKNYVL